MQSVIVATKSRKITLFIAIAVTATTATMGLIPIELCNTYRKRLSRNTAGDTVGVKAEELYIQNHINHFNFNTIHPQLELVHSPVHSLYIGHWTSLLPDERANEPVLVGNRLTWLGHGIVDVHAVSRISCEERDYVILSTHAWTRVANIPRLKDVPKVAGANRLAVRIYMLIGFISTFSLLS